MKGCNEIRRLIDEADQPEIFTFEVTGHIECCQACRIFAGERASLRKLVQAGARVSVPVNFDAVLGERIAQAKGGKTFSWLSPASFMRLGAATAGLVIALLVIQYTGLFSTPQQTQPEIAQTPPVGQPGQLVSPPPKDAGPTLAPRSAPGPSSVMTTTALRTRVPVRREGRVQPVASGDYQGIEDGGVILVRGQNGEREVPMPTVSVGAQPLLYVNATRSAPRNAGTSF
jgi:hypothetical protein